jgi:hypothetical protein
MSVVGSWGIEATVMDVASFNINLTIVEPGYSIVSRTKCSCAWQAFIRATTTISIISTTHQLSEEVQVLGDASNQRLHYVAGLYFSDEHVNYDGDFVNLDILGGNGGYGETEYRQNNRTYAGYGHATTS